jgi:hypothetical protein
MQSRIAIYLCWIQGLYFLLTALWPLVNIESFQLVTGRKTDHLVTGDESDHWLVNTVALLILANAVVLLFAALVGRVATEVALLALTTALALATIDVVYVWRGAIPPVYLVDAAVELIFIALWLAWFWRFPKEKPTQAP